LLSIPYENIDVQLQSPVDLNPDRIYTKLVTNRRGGWCYEMNGLLGWALAEVGFSVKRVSGGVGRREFGDFALGNHVVLLVELDGTHLVDTGMGDGLIDPVPLVEGPVSQRGFKYALEKISDGYWRFHNHEYAGALSFDFREDVADEQLFMDRCEFLQTSPDSPFVSALVMQMFVSGGYEVQTGRVAKRITPEGETSRLLENEAEFADRLAQVFGIQIAEVSRLWSRVVTRHEEFTSENESKK